jgi:hypothetical protein
MEGVQPAAAMVGAMGLANNFHQLLGALSRNRRMLRGLDSGPAKMQWR